MEKALEGGESGKGGELNAGGGGWWSKTRSRGEGRKLVSYSRVAS